METSFHGTDRPPKGFGSGDSFAFTEKLLVRRGVAGSDRVRLFFREGTIAVRGVILATTGPTSLPVTGGTGLFRGQRGRVRVADAPHGHSYLRLTLS